MPSSLSCGYVSSLRILSFFLTSSKNLRDTTEDNAIVLLQSRRSLGSNSGNLTRKLHLSIFLQYTIGYLAFQKAKIEKFLSSFFEKAWLGSQLASLFGYLDW